MSKDAEKRNYESTAEENLAGEEKSRPSLINKGKGQFIAGLLIFVLALCGLSGIIYHSVMLIKSSSAERKQAEYTSYNELLIPVAAVDPTPFDDITGAKMQELIEISVWSILSNDLNPDDYDYSSGELEIPVTEIEAAFAKYFGTERTIEHQSVEGYGYEFAYDSSKSVYCIPLTSITPIYTPSVTGIEKKGSATTISCGLINSSMWMQNNTDGSLLSPAPDKYLKITFRAINGISYIAAIQSAATPETASAASEEKATTASLAGLTQENTERTESTDAATTAESGNS